MSERAPVASVVVGAVTTLSALVFLDKCCTAQSADATAAPSPRPASETKHHNRSGRGVGSDVASKFGLKRRVEHAMPDVRVAPIVPDSEENELAELALDAWGTIASDRGEREHPLTALLRDERFGDDIGLRLTVGVRRACLAAVVFAEDHDSTSNVLHLPCLVGARPEWGCGTEEHRQQEAAVTADTERKVLREQQVEERIIAEVEVRFNEWLVAERAENLYLDTIPQERQQHVKAQIRQQVSTELNRRTNESGRDAPEAVAKRCVADFATSVLGLICREESSTIDFDMAARRHTGHLVIVKPQGYVSYSHHCKSAR